LSETYNDLGNGFPDLIDTISPMTDPSADDLELIGNYITAYNSGDLEGAAAIITANPQLATMLINADKINFLRDAIISIERFYYSDVQQFIMGLVVNRGDWNDSATYSKYNIVTYNSQQYWGIVSSIPIGTLPTDTDYFALWSIKGDTGASGTGLAPRGLWNSGTTYYVDDCVSYDNQLWQCLQEHTNQTPTNGAYWLSILTNTVTAADVSMTGYVKPGSGGAIADTDSVRAAIGKLEVNADVTGGASTIKTTDLTVSRALQSNASGKVAVSTVTSTELGYLANVTGPIQTQINGRAASVHQHTALEVLHIDNAVNANTASVVNMIFGTGEPPAITGAIPQGTIYAKYTP
jgi:hypothetical protein